MAPTTNHSVVLAERPKEGIVPGVTFKSVEKPAATEEELQDGQILAETLYLSLDPAMRGWLKDERSYLPPVQIGEVMRGFSVSRVLASKSTRAKKGDLVYGRGGWQEVAILPDALFEPVPETKLEIPSLLGVLGMTGLTAYHGMLKIGEPKAGETVVVSGAAGATGSVAGQIAKLKGCRVIGIAGGPEKCKWLTEGLGFDVAVDYKAPDWKAKLKEATPDFVNVYFDNVGGETLDFMLTRAAQSARFVMCGGISQYNAASSSGIKNYLNIIGMRIKMQGFIVLDYASENVSARKQLAEWADEGKIKAEETIVKGGLEKAEHALINLFAGKNKGKMILEVMNPAGSKL